MGGKRIYTLFGNWYSIRWLNYRAWRLWDLKASSFKSHYMTLPINLPRYKFCMGASTAADPPISVMKVSGLAASHFR